MNRTPGRPSAIALLVQGENGRICDAPQMSFDGDLQDLDWQVHSQTGPRIQLRLRAFELIKKLYLPQPSQADITSSTLFSWISAICELKGESNALDHALLTFCVIQVAITKTGSACADDALQSYNNSLLKLQVEIEQDGAGQRDEILAAISVLSTYEVLLSSQFPKPNFDITRYLFSPQIKPGALMLKDYRQSCELEVAQTCPHHSG